MFNPTRPPRRATARLVLSIAGFWLATIGGQQNSQLRAQEVPSVLPPVEADIELTDKNYEIWRNHILPDLSEMAWTKIPWLSTFHDGIVAADAEGKPLLLWTMNGHPLGCT